MKLLKKIAAVSLAAAMVLGSSDIGYLPGITFSSYADSEPVYGDTNGDGTVTMADLLLMKQVMVKVPGKTMVTRNADVNNDGEVNMADLLRLKQYMVKVPGVELGEVELTGTDDYTGSVYAKAIAGSEAWYGDEVKDNLYYGGNTSNWESGYNAEKPYVIWRLSRPTAIKAYTLTSTVDKYWSSFTQPPTGWTLYGSNAASDPDKNSYTWKKLSSVTGAVITEDEMRDYTYTISGGTNRYKYYMFMVDSADFSDPTYEANSVWLGAFRLINEYNTVFADTRKETYDSTMTYNVSVGDYIVVTNYRIPTSTLYAYTWTVESGSELADFDGLTGNNPTLLISANKTGTIKISADLQYTDAFTTAFYNYNYHDEIIVNVKPAGTVPHTNYVPPKIGIDGVTCPVCGGSGMYQGNTAVPKFCTRCNGMGVVPG